MKDKNGNTVNVGDKVVFIKHATTNPTLGIGRITKIYANDRTCSVDNMPNIYRNRILSINALKNEGTV